VVAVGAAIQAGVLKGDVKDVLLLDVTPLSLGIETKGQVMHKLIERNTTIPTRRNETFTTADDNQPSVEIHVLQGERDMAMYNKTLGKFQLVDLPPAPRGVPQIDVTFDIDANGIVHVSAKDRATNREQSITITGQSTLSKDEIDQMVRDAEAHAEEDRKRREEAEIRNNADSLVYQTEKLLKDVENIPADEKKAVEDAMAELKTAIEGDDLETIKDATEKLMMASQTVSTKLYEQASAEASGSGAGPEASAVDADEVVDAEIVDDDQDDSCAPLPIRGPAPDRTPVRLPGRTRGPMTAPTTQPPLMARLPTRGLRTTRPETARTTQPLTTRPKVPSATRPRHPRAPNQRPTSATATARSLPGRSLTTSPMESTRPTRIQPTRLGRGRSRWRTWCTTSSG
jgi:hypothetical protein